MHDIIFIRNNPAAFDAALARRGISPRNEANNLLAIDLERREKITELEAYQAQKNRLAKAIGVAKREKKPTDVLEDESIKITKKIDIAIWQANALNAELKTALEGLPNILDDSVPEGTDETHNQLSEVFGVAIRGEKILQHFEIGENIGLMDLPLAAKLSGSRFAVLKGNLARLERALGQWMLNTQIKNGYTEVSVPLLVNEAAMYGTGQLPKFSDDLFKTTDGKWLIPTAEVPLTNMVANSFVDFNTLPLRYVALTPCFRAEAGTAGKDVRGILRQHQFNKVELVSIVEPDKSVEEHERMTVAAENILNLLAIPYRRVLLCAGDTGFSSSKTYDLEVYLPGQDTFREISSCSNMKDFQARRMNARFKKADGTKGFVHTLNGSGVAVGRALIAVMENYQTDKGFHVPTVLQPYMDGINFIGADNVFEG